MFSFFHFFCFPAAPDKSLFSFSFLLFQARRRRSDCPERAPTREISLGCLFAGARAEVEANWAGARPEGKQAPFPFFRFSSRIPAPSPSLSFRFPSGFPFPFEILFDLHEDMHFLCSLVCAGDMVHPPSLVEVLRDSSEPRKGGPFAVLRPRGPLIPYL